MQFATFAISELAVVHQRWCVVCLATPFGVLLCHCSCLSEWDTLLPLPSLDITVFSPSSISSFIFIQNIMIIIVMLCCCFPLSPAPSCTLTAYLPSIEWLPFVILKSILLLVVHFKCVAEATRCT
ncbi:hypothetical protein TRVL_03309 [Trypanosoma vivax]|nr:hypothetical protein TRVL_03309 [Trypanosoma vivax]